MWKTSSNFAENLSLHRTCEQLLQLNFGKHSQSSVMKYMHFTVHRKYVRKLKFVTLSYYRYFITCFTYSDSRSVIVKRRVVMQLRTNGIFYISTMLIEGFLVFR